MLASVMNSEILFPCGESTYVSAPIPTPTYHPHLYPHSNTIQLSSFSHTQSEERCPAKTQVRCSTGSPIHQTDGAIDGRCGSMVPRYLRQRASPEGLAERLASNQFPLDVLVILLLVCVCSFLLLFVVPLFI